jgi:hypothetical protein
MALIMAPRPLSEEAASRPLAGAAPEQWQRRAVKILDRQPIDDTEVQVVRAVGGQVLWMPAAASNWCCPGCENTLPTDSDQFFHCP